MDSQIFAPAPQVIAAQPLSTSVYLPPAAAAQPLQVPVQQYVITDASGQQVLVTGAAAPQQQLVQPVLVQQQSAAGAGVAAAVPAWMVKAGFGVLLLVGGGLGLELMAGVLDHLVHALGELIRLLVTLLCVLAGGAVGLWVLKGVLGQQQKAGGPGAGVEGGVTQAVSQSVAVTVVNQLATGRRGRNHSS